MANRGLPPASRGNFQVAWFLFVELVVVQFLVAAPLLRFLVFAESEKPCCRAELAACGIGLEFLDALL